MAVASKQFRFFFAPILGGMSRYDRPSHRVYMSFFRRQGWQVQFLEADLKTPLPRKLTFERLRDVSLCGLILEAFGLPNVIFA